jgi:L-rhamnose mutarotase
MTKSGNTPAPLIRRAFTMAVNPGKSEAYAKRHNPIWPELALLLKESGAHNYSIFYHPSTNQLFGYVEIEDEARWASISENSVCREWWKHMSEIMPSHPDHSPFAENLVEMFHLE